MGTVSPDLLVKQHVVGAHHCLPATAHAAGKEKASSFAEVAKKRSLPMASASGSALKTSSLKS